MRVFEAYLFEDYVDYIVISTIRAELIVHL